MLQPVVVAELIQKSRLAFDQPTKFVAYGEIGDAARVVLPIREIADQLAVESVIDVVRAARRIACFGHGFRAHVTAPG